MSKRKFFSIIYIVLLLCFTTYALLDTFVIQKSYASLEVSNTTSENSSDINGSSNDSTSEYTKNSDTKITLNTYNEYDTDIYVADIYLDEDDSIYTALADNTFGSNITDTTSNIADSVNATLAINGDFYGVQNSGYVIRNGTLLRSTVKSDDQEDLVLYEDGSMKIIEEGETSADELIEDGAYNVLSFGPGLIEDGEVTVDSSDEVSKARTTTNPRTAIGYIGDNHYVLVVADGRTDESEGLTLANLAIFMADLNCTQAYNLDGGGSSTMYYNGEIVNNPTTNGHTIQEREVSDIVFIY